MKVSALKHQNKIAESQRKVPNFRSWAAREKKTNDQ